MQRASPELSSVGVDQVYGVFEASKAANCNVSVMWEYFSFNHTINFRFPGIVLDLLNKKNGAEGSILCVCLLGRIKS